MIEPAHLIECTSVPPALPKLYKFLHRRDLPLVLEKQTLKICSSDHYATQYRAMEVGDHRINDPNEGVSVWTDGAGGIAVTPEQLAFVNAGMGAVMGGRFGPGEVQSLGNVVVTHHPQFHMLCFCEGDPQEQLKVFNSLLALDGSDDPYDACLEVTDVSGLLLAIMESGTPVWAISNTGVSVPAPKGARFSGIFRTAVLRKVTYRARESDWNSAPGKPEPWFKDLDLQNQREWRIAFDSPVTDDPRRSLHPIFIVHVPGLKRFFAQIFL